MIEAFRVCLIFKTIDKKKDLNYGLFSLQGEKILKTVLKHLF